MCAVGSFSSEQVQEQAALWYSFAHKEWQSISGAPSKHSIDFAKFVHEPIAGPLALADIGAYSHSTRWKSLAIRFTEVSKILQGVGPPRSMHRTAFGESVILDEIANSCKALVSFREKVNTGITMCMHGSHLWARPSSPGRLR